MTAAPTLATAGLHLRRRTPEDAVALFPVMADPDVMRWWSRGPFTSVAELRHYFAEAVPGVRAWSVSPAGGSAPVGFVSVAERRPAVVEILYLFAPSVWGSGMAREAVTAVIDRLFAEGVRRIFADIDPDARPSARLLERLGFQCEGRLRGEWETHIGVRDTLVYGLLRDEWPPLTARG